MEGKITKEEAIIFMRLLNSEFKKGIFVRNNEYIIAILKHMEYYKLFNLISEDKVKRIRESEIPFNILYGLELYAQFSNNNYYKQYLATVELFKKEHSDTEGHSFLDYMYACAVNNSE